MLNEKTMINGSFNSWIDKKDSINEWIFFRIKIFRSERKSKKVCLIDTSKLAKKVDLASLKANVDKLNIEKLKNVPSNLINLKIKVDKLNVDKLVPVPVDLSKLSDAVKNTVVKKFAYNGKINANKAWLFEGSFIWGRGVLIKKTYLLLI